MRRESPLSLCRVVSTNTQETYIGLTQNTFKTRYNLHLSSFKLEHQRKATSLSDHIWKIKDRNNSYTITWKILTLTKRLQSGTGSCDLCTTEKLFIMGDEHKSSLNVKSEFFNKCPHRRAFYTAEKNRGRRTQPGTDPKDSPGAQESSDDSH